jgi:hypothetical protein
MPTQARKLRLVDEGIEWLKYNPFGTKYSLSLSIVSNKVLSVSHRAELSIFPAVRVLRDPSPVLSSPGTCEPDLRL